MSEERKKEESTDQLVEEETEDAEEEEELPIKTGPWSEAEIETLLMALTSKKNGYIEDLKTKFNRTEDDIRRAVGEFIKRSTLRPPESHLMDFLTNPQLLARWQQRGIRSTDGRTTPRIANDAEKTKLHAPIKDRYQHIIKKQQPTAYEKAFSSSSMPPPSTSQPETAKTTKEERLDYDKLYAYMNALYNPHEFDPDKIKLNRKEHAALRIALHSMSVCLSAQYYNGLPEITNLPSNIASMTPPQLLVHQESQADRAILRQHPPAAAPSTKPSSATSTDASS